MSILSMNSRYFSLSYFSDFMYIISVFQPQTEILEYLGDDPLTAVPAIGIKESLADNLRRLNMREESGTATKFVIKAYINIPYHLGPGFHKLNRFEPTFKRADYNIDHIFTSFECKGVKNNMLALGRYKLSDHRLVVSEFTVD